MNINNIKLLEALYPTTSTSSLSNSKELLSDSLQSSYPPMFSELLNNSINNLEQTQFASDQAIEDLISGKAENLHNVMIETTEAQIALELAVQLRNKSLEAMNEIKNMQF